MINQKYYKPSIYINTKRYFQDYDIYPTSKVIGHKCNKASKWSCYMIELPNSCTWLHHPWGWQDTTKLLPPFLLLPLGSKQLPPSSRLLIDQIPIESVGVNCHWV